MRLNLIICIVFIIASCNSQKSKIDSNIAVWIKQHAHNPDSYEPISTKVVDTIFMANEIKQTIEQKTSSIEFDKSQVKYYLNGSKKSRDKFLSEHKDKVALSEDEIAKLKITYDSLLNSPNKNPISGYYIVHECRIKVPLGGLMLKSITFQTDKNLNIITGSEM